MKHDQCGDRDQDLEDLRRDLGASLRIQRKLLVALKGMLLELGMNMGHLPPDHQALKATRAAITLAEAK